VARIDLVTRLRKATVKLESGFGRGMMGILIMGDGKWRISVTLGWKMAFLKSTEKIFKVAGTSDPSETLLDIVRCYL
jgi:hypothetical protein